jgi:hypothetical protein
MRRILLATGGLALTLCLGTAGVASATTPSPHHVKGRIWTQTNLSNHGCEIETLHANGTFTADKLGDAGTYTVVGKVIDETWTAGQDNGQKIQVHWSKANLYYKGKGTPAGGGARFLTTMVPGPRSGC